MKKMLVIAGLFALASCGNSNNSPTYSYAQYDSVLRDLYHNASEADKKVEKKYSLRMSDTPIKKWWTTYEQERRDTGLFYKKRIDSIYAEQNKYYGKK